MRKAAFVLAPLAAAALLAAGCGSDGSPAASDTGADTTTAGAKTAAAAVPTVTGAFGKSAAITLPSDTPGGYSATVVKEGTGPVVKTGDQLTVHYLGETWRGGKVFDQSFERGEPVTFPIGVGQLIPGWDEKLVGQKVGSRVLLVLPPDKGYGEAGNPQAGIEGTDTLVFVVDIVDAQSAG